MTVHGTSIKKVMSKLFMTRDKTHTAMVNKEKEVDVFRDTYVRYLGYTNEVGEAFRSVVPRYVVGLSYSVASGYVLADALHKARRVYLNDTTPDKKKHTLLSASDTLIWQGFASVIIPGIIINRLCAGVRLIQRKFHNKKYRNPWIRVVAGLASIPFIIHPIDVFVEKTMNATYREWTEYDPNKPLK